MPSLADLQHAFADAVLGVPGAGAGFVAGDKDTSSERLAIYRNTILSNYRKALAATYPVVKRSMGAAAFDSAVDAFVRAHPSRSGDLNVYGDAFGGFLTTSRAAASMPWLADLAHLEWAIDEAHRAPDASIEDVLASLAAVAPERLPLLRLRLEPSCRLIASAFPVLRIWKAASFEGHTCVSSSANRDTLLIRRDTEGVSVERVEAGEHAWLAALASGATLGAAIDAAQTVDPLFDLATALRAHIAAKTIVAVLD